MGTWDSGNFDNDTAADYLADVTTAWIEEIQEAIASPDSLEPDEDDGNTVPCIVEMLTLIASQHWAGANLPELDEAKEWKRVFMEVWEENIDDLEPQKDYKKERRDVLNATFDKLIGMCEEREED